MKRYIKAAINNHCKWSDANDDFQNAYHIGRGWVAAEKRLKKIEDNEEKYKQMVLNLLFEKGMISEQTKNEGFDLENDKDAMEYLTKLIGECGFHTDYIHVFSNGLWC